MDPKQRKKVVSEPGNSMKQKQLGRIIFISSESALQIPVEIIHYGMTKTARSRYLSTLPKQRP
jgi:short-subunit dehydrogenase